jgi:hypothetical protein
MQFSIRHEVPKRACKLGHPLVESGLCNAVVFEAVLTACGLLLNNVGAVEWMLCFTNTLEY